MKPHRNHRERRSSRAQAAKGEPARPRGDELQNYYAARLTRFLAEGVWRHANDIIAG